MTAVNTISAIETAYGVFVLKDALLKKSERLRRRKDGSYDMRQPAAKALIEYAEQVMREEYESEAA